MSSNPSPRSGRDLWSFGRSDRWGLTVLLGLLALGTALAEVVGPIVGWARGGDLSVPSFGTVTVPALDAAGITYGPAEYDISVAGPTLGQRLLDLVPGLVVTAGVVAGCWLVLLVMRDIAAGDSFRPRNVTRLRALAVLIAVGIPAIWFARISIDLAMLTQLDLGDVGPGVLLRVPWVPVVVGTVLALVAEAFKAGSRLRDDVEGLV